MKRLTPPYIVAVAFAAVVQLYVAADAAADNGAVVVYGDVQPQHRDVVTAAVTAAVRGASWTVDVAAPFASKETEGIIACLARERPWSCLGSTVESRRLAHMAVVRVERDGAGLKLVEQILVADGDWVPSIEQAGCSSPCTDAALDEAATALTKLLVERTAARRGGTALEIRTIPGGALITFDGAMLGQTTRIQTTPGEHTVLIQLTGFRSESRTVTVKPGEAHQLELVLISTSGGPGSGERRARLPVVLVGAGVVALAGGIALIALDQDPVSSPDQDAERRYRDTAVPGIGLAIGGTIAAVIGGYLRWRGPAKRSVTAVAPVGGGVAFGVITTF